MHIIYSTQDPAGVNICRSIKDNLKKNRTYNINITKIDISLLYADEVVNNIETEFIIFASKHKSESKRPSFTVHVPGNWNKAEMGGRDKEISYSDPIKMKALIMTLHKKVTKNMKENIPVTMEVDHHGPLCKKPCSFIEIGSGEEQWNNKEYGDIVGETIVEFMDNINNIDVKTIAVGVGGGHYCPAFNKPEIEGNIAFAHIIPNYAVEEIEYETFVQSIKRSTEEVEKVLIDWKGLKQKERQKILDFTKEFGIDYVRV